MSPFVVQFYKNPNILHWGFAGVRVGEDDHGLWVGLPRGSRRWKGTRDWPLTAAAAVLCFPHDGWWVLHYSGPATRFTHFVDIATQPRWDDQRVVMVDLDLDVVRRQDGTVEIEDEDEFEDHQVLYSYTREMIERARAETDMMVEALRRGDEPYFGTAQSWLDAVAAVSPPGA